MKPRLTRSTNLWVPAHTPSVGKTPVKQRPLFGQAVEARRVILGYHEKHGIINPAGLDALGKIEHEITILQGGKASANRGALKEAINQTPSLEQPRRLKYLVDYRQNVPSSVRLKTFEYAPLSDGCDIGCAMCTTMAPRISADRPLPMFLAMEDEMSPSLLLQFANDPSWYFDDILGAGLGNLVTNAKHNRYHIYIHFFPQGNFFAEQAIMLNEHARKFIDNWPNKFDIRQSMHMMHTEILNKKGAVIPKKAELYEKVQRETLEYLRGIAALWIYTSIYAGPDYFEGEYEPQDPLTLETHQRFSDLIDENGVIEKDIDIVLNRRGAFFRKYYPDLLDLESRESSPLFVARADGRVEMVFWSGKDLYSPYVKLKDIVKNPRSDHFEFIIGSLLYYHRDWCEIWGIAETIESSDFRSSTNGYFDLNIPRSVREELFEIAKDMPVSYDQLGSYHGKIGNKKENLLTSGPVKKHSAILPWRFY